MTKEDAMKLISEKLGQKGMPASNFCFQPTPARIEFITKGKAGPERRSIPLKRSWRKSMIEDWIERHVEPAE